MVFKISKKHFIYFIKLLTLFIESTRTVIIPVVIPLILNGFLLFLKLKKINKLQTQLQSKRYKSELRIKLNIVSLL